jgi:hypothetical protein
MDNPLATRLLVDKSTLDQIFINLSDANFSHRDIAFPKVQYERRHSRSTSTCYPIFKRDAFNLAHVKITFCNCLNILTMKPFLLTTLPAMLTPPALMLRVLTTSRFSNTSNSSTFTTAGASRTDLYSPPSSTRCQVPA